MAKYRILNSQENVIDEIEYDFQGEISIYLSETEGGYLAFVGNSTFSLPMVIPTIENFKGLAVSLVNNVVCDLDGSEHYFNGSYDTDFYVITKENVPVHTETVHINVYQNTEEASVVSKNPTYKRQYVGTFIEPFNVIRPSINLYYSGVIDFNYIYIQEFGRYYYVIGSTYTYKMVILELELDPLKSYDGGIRECIGFIDRNENTFNPKLLDKNRVCSSFVNVIDRTVDNYVCDSYGFNYVIVSCRTQDPPADAPEWVEPENDNNYVGSRTSSISRLQPNSINNVFCAGRITNQTGMSTLGLHTFLNFTDINQWFGGSTLGKISSMIYYPFSLRYGLSDTIYQSASFGSDNIDAFPNIVIGDKDAYLYMGSVNILGDGNDYYQKEFMLKYDDDSYRLFSPYTTVRLYLPYYGYVDLENSVIINKAVQIRLKIDILSGGAKYIIGVSDTTLNHDDTNYKIPKNDANMKVISEIPFMLGYVMPTASSNGADAARNTFMSLASMGVNLAIGNYLGAGVSVSNTVKSATSTTTDSTRARVRNEATGRLITAGTNNQISETTDTTNISTKSDYKGTYKTRVISSAIENSVESLNWSTKSQGSMTANNCVLWDENSKCVRVEIRTAQLNTQTSDFKHLYGLPLGETKTLGELTGYTEISSVHIEGNAFATATKEEIDMLQDQLLSGIIL